MRVTNNTKAVINYGAVAYAPGKSFEVAEEHTASIEPMLADGRLAVDLGGEPAKVENKTANKK